MRGTKRRLRPNVWEVRISLGKDPTTGKYGRLSKTIYGSAKDADDALRDLIIDHVPETQEAVGATFGSVLDRWLAECERLQLSPTTIRTYRLQVDKTIRPALGNVPLTRLTARHLDELYGSMRAEGRSPKTIRNHHAVISVALHQAERWGWVRRNVAELAKPPRTTQRRIKAPTVEAVRSLIVAAEERDPRLAPLLMLGALTGMRRGELCGLRWSDIDIELGQLTISRSVVCAPNGLVVKATKTDRDRRVALDEVASALLQRHRTQVDKWARIADASLVEDAYVFSPYIDGGKPFRPDNVTSFFIGLRNKLGLKVRLHDLRHFTATQLIGSGVDVRTVAGRLGHSDPSVTLRVYSDVIEERDRAAASIMGNVLTPPKEAVANLASAVRE
jgi:integrase